MPEWTREDQIAAVLRLRHDLQRLTHTKLRYGLVASLALLAVTWFFLGSAGVSAAIERGELSGTGLALFGLAAAVNFAALVLAIAAAYFAVPSRTWAWWFVVVVVLANAITTLTDQVGAADVLYLLLCLLALGLALAVRISAARRPRGAPGR